MSQVPVITVDGPSGAGKGTLARALAECYGWNFLDSGAIYRLLGYAVDVLGMDGDDVPSLLQWMQAVEVRFEADPHAHVITVWANGEDVTRWVRHARVAQLASKLASVPDIRLGLVQKQRDFCKPPGLVADGRDMGTTIFPKAGCKLYLTADAIIRAQRRFKQLQASGQDVSLSELTDEIRARDARDEGRSCSPLQPAADAVVIDASELRVDQVLAVAHTHVCAAFGW